MGVNLGEVGLLCGNLSQPATMWSLIEHLALSGFPRPPAKLRSNVKAGLNKKQATTNSVYHFVYSPPFFFFTFSKASLLVYFLVSYVLLMKGWWKQLMFLPNDLNNMGVVLSRMPVNTLSSISDREANSTDSDHSSVIPKVCEPEGLLVPALPETASVERGYITPHQIYNLLNAEDGQPAIFDPYYMLILDCRKAERYKDSHVVTARAAVTVIHPELGCLISCIELQKYSIILLYAEEGCSPVGSVKARADSPDLQRCFFQLSGLGMDPIIMLGGFSAFNALYPFLCTTRMVLIEPERHTLTIYPSEILENALYQGSVSQASDYRIIKNLQITHVVNATANCPDAFPNTLCYLRLRLSDDSQQDLVEALPLASRFINTALRAVPAGRVLVHCSMGRSRSSALTLAFLMQHRCWSLLHAVRWLKEKRACTAPNVNFLRQLLTYEEQLFGRRLTSLDDIRR
ncbi:serine/threonine/tyrosine-interacting-like protein 1 isoform X2 [Cynoglossus semilaevis]|uniref:protein-tyrosine-phosphatase n=1 Tax=Cynoglossus semilaevis TaxID=244447 RepID=A0A3P8UZ71_CYNSE|nr:serine/threonine/tyrosine-interacting-like protein 1 isoform X2 [Cynoglossus semilaevis]